ncbi:MAG: substrate-binding domain-containing protein [Planctomycetes bacterium]|nr:substrate-binding domain-containing protein [Planctomycetota bacterium]
MRSLVLACSLVTTLSAQGPVRVVSTMRVDAVAAVEAHLRERLPDLAFDVQRIDEAELVQRFVDGMEVDVVAGVDAQLCELAAASRRFAPVEFEAGSWYDDPDHRFVTPWASGWVMVWITSQVDQPLALEELITNRWTDELVVPSPRAAPSLWAGWLRQLGRSEVDEEEAFGWLHALDGRIVRYTPTIGAAAAAVEMGTGSLAWLPADVAVEFVERYGRAKLGLGFLREGVELAPFGVGVVASSVRPDAAQRTFDALLEPELAIALREEHGLFLPDEATYSELLQPVFDAQHAYAPIEAHAALDWLHRFDSEVRGKRRGYENVGYVLDIVMTLAFFVAVWLVMRTINKEELDAG